MNDRVPDARIRTLNDAEISAEGDYILYWMIAFRRPHWNYSLQRAVEWATELRKPLVVFEALRCGYRWASDRLHQFVIQGMAANQVAFRDSPVLYYPYLESEHGAGRGLLESLAARAAIVVTDDFPCFFLPRMINAAAQKISVRCEAVDSNGILPMRAAEKVFARAHDFRRFLQKQLHNHWETAPQADPLADVHLPQPPPLPAEVVRQWPEADVQTIASAPEMLSEFPIDHAVGVASTAGGWKAAADRLQTFLTRRLPRYDEARNQPEQPVTSGLSPFLHFGHVSAHQIFHDLMQQEEWTPNKVAAKATGSSNDWWGVSEPAESFLDEFITWREVGYNMCSQRDDYDQYESLPEWARKTLADHENDPREHVYDLEQFEAASTHDPLWNAAQRQLLREGTIHNYLRMLWGKKILHWSESPRAALDILIELNNKYALDGRNPNSYSGIFWTLGRYDRAWGPERPIFGKVRYMTSDNTARKVRVKEYLKQYGPRTDAPRQRCFSDAEE